MQENCVNDTRVAVCPAEQKSQPIDRVEKQSAVITPYGD